MAWYIVCRSCDAPDCKGCNLKRLETMLENGKFDCLMNENRAINTSAEVEPVQHGQWLHRKNGVAYCSECGVDAVEDGTNYCPDCGAKMDGGAD